MPNILVFTLSLIATTVISALLLWAGTKLISGFKVALETIFWVSLVTQIFRCTISLGTGLLIPGHPKWGFAIVICSVIYAQALILRLAVGVTNQDLSRRKAGLISFLTVLVGFAGVIPLVAWSLKQISS